MPDVFLASFSHTPSESSWCCDNHLSQASAEANGRIGCPFLKSAALTGTRPTLPPARCLEPREATARQGPLTSRRSRHTAFDLRFPHGHRLSRTTRRPSSRRGVVRGTRESDVEMTARDSFEGAALVLRDRGLADVAESSIRNRSDAWRTPLGSLRCPCRKQHLTQRRPDLRCAA